MRPLQRKAQRGLRPKRFPHEFPLGLRRCRDFNCFWALSRERAYGTPTAALSLLEPHQRGGELSGCPPCHAPIEPTPSSAARSPKWQSVPDPGKRFIVGEHRELEPEPAEDRARAGLDLFLSHPPKGVAHL